MVTNPIREDRYGKYRLTVEQYYRMADVGVLAQDVRTELVEGEIFDMAPIGCRHSATVAWLHRQLLQAVGERALVFAQSPARLSRMTEPQPDLMLLRPRVDGYSEAHPAARDILLLIEVSDSTLLYDREIKVPLYATYGIAEVWLVDVFACEFFCYRGPHGGAYMETVPVRPRMTAVPSLEVSVDLTQLFTFGQSVS